MLHDFLITENDEGNSVFAEEDGCVSDIDVDNELNFLVNDEIEENE